MEVVEGKLDFKLIGKRIKEARLKKGISQEKLSEMIDVTVVYISRIERGTTKVNLNRLAQLSIVLETPIEKLITGTTIQNDIYLKKEFQELLSKCTPEKQKLIYNIAKIVSGINFV